MEPHSTSFLVAFLAGLLSFISPCVLPLVPAYLAYVAGRRGSSLPHAAAFVLGFSVVFIALGASASFIGQLFTRNQDALRIFGGVLILIFGIHLVSPVKIPFFEMEKRIDAHKASGLFGSFMVGLAFAAGWTPCIGPILGSILVYVAATETVARGTLLLTAYAAGLAVPFLLSALSVDRFLAASKALRSFSRWSETVSGLLLMAVGILLLVNAFTPLAALLERWFPFRNIAL